LNYITLDGEEGRRLVPGSLIFLTSPHLNIVIPWFFPQGVMVEGRQWHRHIREHWDALHRAFLLPNAPTLKRGEFK